MSKNRSPLLPLCVLACGLLPSWAQAQEGQVVPGKELLKSGFFQDFAELDLEALLDPEETQTSIASRREQGLERAPGLVSVVTREEIVSMGARTLEDILLAVPGFDVMTDSLGHGRIIFRGIASRSSGSSSEVLILWNGHRLNEELTGGATVVNLDISAENIKKLEVLRGPGSALFGAGAVAAVVNIVTYRHDDLAGTELKASGGSFGTQQYLLRTGSFVKGIKVYGFVRFVDSVGAKLLVPADAQTTTDQAQSSPDVPKISLAPGRTTDERRSIEASYRFDYKNFDLSWRLKSESSGGFIGATDSLGKQNDLNNRQFLVDAHYRRSAGPYKLAGTLAFTQNEVRQLLELVPPGFVKPIANGFVQFPSGIFLQTAFNSRRYGAEAVAERDLPGGHLVSAGIGLERESTFGQDAQSNAAFPAFDPRPFGPLQGAAPESGRNVFGLWAQDTWSRPSLTLTGGLRLDHISAVGGSLNPRLALVGTPPAWLQKHLPKPLATAFSYKLLYGRSYRAPSIAERSFELPGYTGNPDLRPTTANTFDAAVSFKKKDARVTVDYFLAFVRNTITLPGPYSLRSTDPILNGPGINARGLEVEARQGFGAGRSVFLSFTHQHAEDSETEVRLADVPTTLAHLGATLNIRERVAVTPHLTLRSSRPRAPQDTRLPVDGYGLIGVNLRGFNLYRTLELSVSVDNLFGTKYHDPSPLGGVPGDYPRPGRRIFAYASYKF